MLARFLDVIDEEEDSILDEDKKKLEKIEFSKSGQFRTRSLDWDAMEDPVFR